MAYDALVVGLGAMGSAALYHLAGRGCRVAGVDAFDPPHVLGSTHGRSRIIREAYYEHPSYVPLVRRAYENWAALERSSGTTLFRETGGLMIGPPTSGLIQGTLDSVRTHDIAVETLSSADIRRRFPAFAPPEGMIGVLEKRAGVLDPEACIRVHLQGAAQRGAVVASNTRVIALDTTTDGISARCSTGETLRARRVIIAAGPWASELLASMGVTLPLEVERQTMHWLDSDGDRGLLTPDRMPIMMIEHEPDRLFYSIPDFGDGVKTAIHHEGERMTVGSVRREVGPEDTKPVLDLLRRYIPAASGRIRESTVCLYTDTPDLDFVLGPLDAAPNVVLVSACSGHGFKFASAIGDVAACMALGESVDLDLMQFRPGRFSKSGR